MSGRQRTTQDYWNRQSKAEMIGGMAIGVATDHPLCWSPLGAHSKGAKEPEAEVLLGHTLEVSGLWSEAARSQYPWDQGGGGMVRRVISQPIASDRWMVRNV